MAVAQLVAAILLTLTCCYYLSVLVVGRWWGLPGRLAMGRNFTSLPARIVAGLYLIGLLSITASAWADVLLHQEPTWASLLVGAGLLTLLLTVLAEGLLPRWRPASGSGRTASS